MSRGGEPGAYSVWRDTVHPEVGDGDMASPPSASGMGASVSSQLVPWSGRKAMPASLHLGTEDSMLECQLKGKAPAAAVGNLM